MIFKDLPDGHPGVLVAEKRFGDDPQPKRYPTWVSHPFYEQWFVC